MSKLPSPTPSDRRRLVRATLVGSALLTPPASGHAVTAVLDNVNKLGGGFHTKAQLAPNTAVIVTLVFLDQHGDEQQEKLAGTVAWVKNFEKKFLIGVVWDDVITPERNRWLTYYLEEPVKTMA
ncbi:MAG: PilZ domain-containing protein [Nitrospiraceae bacterium]